MYHIGRLHGLDLRTEPDMHIALWRKVGRLEGGIGIGGDFAKGAIAVLVARALGFEVAAVALAGLAAVAGQMWPIFLKFNGEKGNSIGLVMVAVLAYKPLLFALIPMAIGAGVRTIPRFLKPRQQLGERLRFGGPPSRSLPLAMCIAFALLPLLAWLLDQPPAVVWVLLALFLLIEIRRATAGIRKDLRIAKDKKSVLINRLLYDRGFL